MSVIPRDDETSDLDPEPAEEARWLERFAESQDERAFEALVRKHGPMVLSVCRRILGDLDEADDAFQAVFIVLARRAKHIRCRTSLGSWLHGVAFRVAMKAKRCLRRSRHLGDQTMDLASVAAGDKSSIRELSEALDAELCQLPAKERAAIVLCDLEGRSHKEAARELRLPTGTVSSHLTRGRRRLRERLQRRGCILGASVSALIASGTGSVSAALPAAAVKSLTAAAVGGSMDLPAGATVLAKWFLLTGSSLTLAKAAAMLVLLGAVCLQSWRLEEGEPVALVLTVDAEAGGTTTEPSPSAAPSLRGELPVGEPNVKVVLTFDKQGFRAPESE